MFFYNSGVWANSRASQLIIGNNHTIHLWESQLKSEQSFVWTAPKELMATKRFRTRDIRKEQAPKSQVS